MRVELPSGNTVDFRDKMMRGDVVDARRGMKFVTAPDGSRVMDGAFLDGIRARIITVMMYDWSFERPLPRDCGSEPQAATRLDQMLDADDAMALDMAVQPWVDRIVRDAAANRHTVTHTQTGIVLRVADEDEAQRLVAAGGFTVPETAPKAVQSSSVTALPASPAPNGQEATTDQTP